MKTKQQFSCPFCGSGNVELTSNPAHPAHCLVFCKRCGAMGPIKIGSRAAFEAWETQIVFEKKGEER